MRQVTTSPPPRSAHVLGSLQELVEHESSAEDMGTALFEVDEVHKIGILDIRLLNLDRHLGNILVVREKRGPSNNRKNRLKFVPIDHSHCLPSISSLSDIKFEWAWWPQCSQPFSQKSLDYIASLDAFSDSASLRALGLRDDAVVMNLAATLLLKRCVESGLNLREIAEIVQRGGDLNSRSTLERVVESIQASGIVQAMRRSSPPADDDEGAAPSEEGSAAAAAAGVTPRQPGLLQWACDFCSVIDQEIVARRGRGSARHLTSGGQSSLSAQVI